MGINVNGKGGDADEDTPLRVAARLADVDLIETLVSHVAKATFAEQDCRFTAVKLASGAHMDLERVVSVNSDIELIDSRAAGFLLGNGTDPNATSRYCLCVAT